MVRAGDIVYIHVFGQGLLICNTYEVATDLLEKQGSIYSDKPHLVMAGELYVFSPLDRRIYADVACRCGCENMVPFIPLVYQ